MMNVVFPALIAVPPLLLLAAGLIPSALANRQAAGMRFLATALAGLALASALAAAACLAWLGPLDACFGEIRQPLPLSLGVFFDGLAAVMFLLISFIGLIIVLYSARYLDGESTQGQFLRWLLFALGAVLFSVLARNLVMFVAGWMLTSFGLHQLLTHYPDRPWAIWAARKKFLISRLGDAFLVAALVLTYQTYGSFDYRVVFAAANALAASGGATDWSTTLISLLFVCGAMTKSAQLPFHSWLPETLETPTPVSALMHAGIINAGGFLVIRLSPLVALSSFAMDLLVVVGAATALVASLVMLTQTSVKRSLAFSTIAQMGFMMLQCGLGSFASALLHIVGHSLYKSHAFLASGSVLESGDGGAPARYAESSGRGPLPLVAAVVVGLLLGGAVVLALDLHLTREPGAAVLAFIFTIALTQLLWIGFARQDGWQAGYALGGALGMSLAYVALHLAFESVLHHSAISQLVRPAPSSLILAGMIGLGFLGAFALQWVAGQALQSQPLRSLYVHAMHGFYLDIPLRRLAAFVWGQSSPTP